MNGFAAVFSKNRVHRRTPLRAAARGAAAHALQTGAISDELELITALAGVTFIALQARILDGFGRVGQGFALEFNFVRDTAITISVAITSMAWLDTPSRGKQFRADGG